jgi:adenylate cyclase
VLYGLSPKTSNPEMTIDAIALGLGLYGGFTSVRFTLAIYERVPNWLLYLSVVVDMPFLYGLIWSFHLQYDQDAGLYLKAPTLLYVFIFIALRALRFDARYLLLSGGAGYCGMQFTPIKLPAQLPKVMSLT